MSYVALEFEIQSSHVGCFGAVLLYTKLHDIVVGRRVKVVPEFEKGS